ncbi:transglutaminase, partial [Algibacter sp.]|nr:transglutaminase [Algibacter sp.]
VKESQADIIGDKIYFSPLFFLKTGENPFKLEKREFPVDFGYPSVTSYRVVVSIPEGYKIESVPEAGVFMMPDNLCSFKYNISAQGNKVQLSIVSDINESIITPLYYEALKMYFSKIVEKEAEQIVLTKG